jgi:alcohol dehydrogenase
MDCAKGINFLLSNGGQMQDYWGVGKAQKAMLPSIGVPTTAGTGSEAQSFALIGRADTHEKMACGDRKARFHTAILDPLLVMSVPAAVRAAAGIDAISHAVESYVSTKRNSLSQLFAREAFRLLAQNFETHLQQPQNLEAAGAMQLGAHLAGMAIENSMLGAAHACANPLTARYGTPHGHAVALMLPHVVRHNGAAVGAQYEELGQEIGIDNGAEGLALAIEKLRSAAGLPGTLSAAGLCQKELSSLATEASKQWTGTFNPLPMNEEDFLQLYEQAY